MKRKIFYSLILFCFIGLLSSANQNVADCKKEAQWLAAKTNTCCPKAIKTESPVPLNLFLFDL